MISHQELLKTEFSRGKFPTMYSFILRSLVHIYCVRFISRFFFNSNCFKWSLNDTTPNNRNSFLKQLISIFFSLIFWHTYFLPHAWYLKHIHLPSNSVESIWSDKQAYLLNNKERSVRRFGGRTNCSLV